MTLRSSPAGSQPGARSRYTRAPRALVYDPNTKDFLRDETGAYQTQHPVDQMMGIALFIAKKSVKSAIATGSELKDIKHIGGPRFEATVRNKVMAAIFRELTRDDVEIVSIDVETSGRHGFLVQVDYFNLRVLPRPARPRSIRH